MADYTEQLRQDLVEQFKEKPVIDALISAIGEQLTDLHRFFTALRDERGVLTAIGKQLDGVGDIVCLSREEAGAMACIAESVYVLDDEEYRDYLIFKIWKNTNNCTYHDVIKAFRMFWPKPLYYHEDPEEPAVMILDTGILKPEDHAEKLFTAPFIKAAGVGIRIMATTETPPIESELRVTPFLGRGMAITKLPELEPEIPAAGIYVAPAIGRGMSITELPVIEPDLGTAAVLGRISAAAHGSIMETRLPLLPEYDTEVPAAVNSRFFAALHGSIMETRLPELKEEFV